MTRPSTTMGGRAWDVGSVYEGLSDASPGPIYLPDTKIKYITSDVPSSPEWSFYGTERGTVRDVFPSPSKSLLEPIGCNSSHDAIDFE